MKQFPAADVPGKPPANHARRLLAAEESAPTVRNSVYQRLPIALVLVVLVIGGVFLLNRADTQARDTIRKHHLEDLEQALYVAQTQHGTFPPYDQTTWCGNLDEPGNENVRAEVEQALRAQNDTYANPDKPFPTDPLPADQSPGYFYWKRSPAIFELYAALETNPNGERSTVTCTSSQAVNYDYGLTSIWRAP